MPGGSAPRRHVPPNPDSGIAAGDEGAPGRLVSVRAATFLDAACLTQFSLALIAETESKRFDVERVRRGVCRGLSLAPEVRYFVADVGGCSIATLMITREWSDWRDGWLWWIQSVYVESAWRRRGVYRSMIEFIADLAGREGDVVGLRLYVEQDNESARQAYVQTGFCDAGYRVFYRELTPVSEKSSSPYHGR